jgi:hypothetical protein
MNVFIATNKKDMERITSSSLSSNECSNFYFFKIMFVGWSGEELKR